MSSEILLPGTSKEMQFGEIRQRDGSSLHQRTKQLLLPCLYSVLFPFAAKEKIEKGKKKWDFSSQVLFLGIARENLDIGLL